MHGARIADSRGVAFTSFTTATAERAHARARTILGWTPGLRTLVSSGVLPCGCLAGTYETWSQQIVTIVDEKSGSCPHADHDKNAILR